MTEEQEQGQQCMTCYGLGEVPGGISSPTPCEDCGGIGVLFSSYSLTESRLRELESRYASGNTEIKQDVHWLVTQVRVSRHTLLQLLAIGQDSSGPNPDPDLAARVQFIANGALGTYAVEDVQE